MSKVKLYNQAGQENGEIELDDTVFGIKPKKSVLHQVYNALLANARQPWAHSKDKSEVRGGGKKPWKQKGTGRARHGSNRSPIWSGGGVTFGPLNIRNYKQKINKKTNRLAVKMSLSDKVNNNLFVVIEDFNSDGKTKSFSALRKALPGSGRSTILLAENNDEKLNLATRNFKTVDMQQAKDVNLVDLLHHEYVLITKKGVEVLQKRLTK